MSTYDDSSLFLYPSGYKASVLFAQKPMDANGQLAFTRSNDTATRVDENGLIEKVRTNLILQSETFGNASWGKSLVTITDNFDTAPNGTLTADRFVSAGGAFPQIAQARTVVSGTQYTASLYVKSDGTTQIAQVLIIGGNTVSFTPTNTWQRITATFTAASSSATFVLATNSAVAPASSFVIWGAQLETGDIATDYIATTTTAVSVGPLANIPRIDYLGGGCGKLLLEPQRTNICLWSENFDNATWVKIGTTVTANNAVSPDGYTNAAALVENTATSLHDTYQAFVSTSSTAYTFSCYIKPSTRTRAYLRSDTSAGTVRTLFDLTGSGSVVTLNHTSASISLVGNGWYRCSITFTEGTGAAGRLVFVEGAVSTSINYAGNGLTAFWLYGAQLEAGSYASSYVNTLAASVTRGADVCSKTGISSLIGQTEGTLFVDLNYETVSGLSMFLSIRPNSTNKIEVYRDGQTIYGDILGNSVSVLLSKSANPASRYKIALAYKSGQTSLYINGTSVGTSATAFSFATSMADLFINLRSGPTFVEQAFYNQAILFKTRLPNSELAALTAL